MNKIVPFKKEILFNTGINEVVSISLEHNYNINDNNIIDGNFYINGEYRISTSSTSTDTFNKEVPFTIDVGENYNINNISIDIDDFYYEIINSNYLSINIDLLIKNLEEIEIKDDFIEETEERNLDTKEEEIELDINNHEEERCIENEDDCEEEIMIEKPNDTYTFTEEELSEDIKTPSFNEQIYSTYKIYIVKEEETIESIMTKFEINKEALEKYNNLEEIKIGDKLIIPTTDVRN